MWLPIEPDNALPVDPVPIFPLPERVLLPGEPLPLHIFEQRYRVMTESAIGSERLIALAHLKPGWETDYEGSPAIYSVAGLGKIVMDERLADGRFNLLLWGLKRIRILEEVRGHPFRAARVEILDDTFSKTSPELLDSLESDILRLARKLAVSSKNSGVALDPSAPPASDLEPGSLPLSVLCDTVASTTVNSSLDKQMLLEETDVVRRAEKLIFLMGLQFRSTGQSFSGPSATIH